MTVNNFELIRSLLTFNSKDDFYFVQVLQRKKDHDNRKVNGTNNNSRLVKAYYINSFEKFDFVTPEIIELCEIFGARAGINLNRRSYRLTTLLTLRKITEHVMNSAYDKSHSAFNTVCGEKDGRLDKTWLFDFDEGDDVHLDSFMNCMNRCMPDKDKLIAKVPSRAGFHLITHPFDLKTFSELLKSDYGLDWKSGGKFLSLHKNNPTNLYIPERKN